MKNAKILRDGNLTVHMTKDELNKLEELRKLISPYAPISKGKAMGAAVTLALQALKSKVPMS